MDIRNIIETALRTTVAQPDEGSTTGQKHRNRSKNWVEALGAGLREHYNNQPNVRVFTKHYGENRLEFGMNEILYDVMVCETAYTKSATGGKQLAYVTKALWQVESEFAKNSRGALYDFNKLVVGTADSKLFVGPITHDVKAFRDCLLPAANCCSGEVYLALLPHPESWCGEGQKPKVTLSRLTNRGWTEA